MRKKIEILQIQLVRSLPMLRSIMASMALTGLQNNMSTYLFTGMLCLLSLPVAITHKIYSIIANKIMIGQVSLSITTRCTLKCKECVNFIPYYHNPIHIPTDEILNDIDILLHSVDYIYTIQILGGEPFLHPDIDKIITHVMQYKNIGKINMITNGSIIPNLETINLMKNKKIRVQVSGYPKHLIKNINEFLKILNNNNIKYNYSSILKWKFIGDKKYIKRDLKEKINLFKMCAFSICNHLYRGKYYICSFSAHGMDVGFIPIAECDYINIRHLSANEIKKKLKILIRKNEIAACDYCNGSTFLTKTISPAEQIV